MNSADVWHPTNNPDGDMTPILEASVEAAKMRHPSGVILTAQDRCDADCGAAAAYRVQKVTDPFAVAEAPVLDFCLHHWRKYYPYMTRDWTNVGGNPTLLAELGQEALDHGGAM